MPGCHQEVPPDLRLLPGGVGIRGAATRARGSGLGGPHRRFRDGAAARGILRREAPGGRGCSGTACHAAPDDHGQRGPLLLHAPVGVPGCAQGGGQLLGGLEAVGRILGQGAVQEGLDVPADALEGRGRQGPRVLVQQSVDDRAGAGSVKGWEPRQGLVEDHADAKQVAAAVRVAALQVLGGHVVHGPEDRALVRAVGVEDLGHTKVQQLGQQALPVPDHADVGGLEVPVEDLVAVGHGQAIADLSQHIQDIPGREVARPDQGGQVLALHQLHGQVEHPLLLAHLIDRDDVRVVQHPGGPGLIGKPLPGPRSHAGRGVDDLDGHLPADDRIAPQVHLAHASLGEESHDLELAKAHQH